MQSFQFIPVTPHPLLDPYIAKMYVFESYGRLPSEEKKLIVPNANFKLTLTYQNGIKAVVGERVFIQRENNLSLTGLINRPVTLDAEDDTQTGTIIIEFNPLGAYRLFHLCFNEVTNQIVELADLIGKHAEKLRLRLIETDNLDMKLHFLQAFLIRQIDNVAPDSIFDYCVNRIAYSKGLISVAQLEKETGYTSRWLNKKFSERLGTGPKNLSEIIRFNQVFEAYSTRGETQNFKDSIYKYYYDQSHLIKAFRRFTGYTPTDLQDSANELAAMHFKS